MTGTAGHDSSSWGIYFMDKTGLYPLPMIKNTQIMTPHSINERDEVVGTMHSTRNRDVAFYASKGKSHRLFDLLDEVSRANITSARTAWSINDAGQIVGMALVNGGYGYPFIATPVAPPAPPGVE
jgi:hypothetical protein